MSLAFDPESLEITALDIIRPALRLIGAIDPLEQPKAEQVAVALDSLNLLMDTLRVSAGAAINNEEMVLTLARGAKTHTINRPLRVEGAYARLHLIDRPIRVVDKAEFDSVSLKGLNTSWPEIVWCDGNAPYSSLHFWPQPASDIEVHVTVLKHLVGFVDATTAEVLPAGYRNMLTKLLAVEVAPAFGLEPSASLVRSAALAQRAYTRANTNVPDMEVGVRVTSRLGQFLGGGN
jgi:hypothetical protein